MQRPELVGMRGDRVGAVQLAGVRDHQRVTPLGILSSWHSSGMGLLLCQHAYGETQYPEPTGLRTP